jgi:hypothetical protein
MTEQTALQRLVDEQTADEMIEKFETALDETAGTDELQGFEVTFTVTPVTLPYLIEELRGVGDE